MGEITLEFDHALSDRLHADRVYYAHGAFAKIDKAAAVLLAGAGVALVAAAGPRWWCFVPFPLAIFEWFNLLSIRPLQIRIFFARNPRFQERCRLTFSEDGIHFTTPTIDSRLAWTYYTRFLESERVFLLVYGKWMYTVLPKGAFKGPAEIDRFRDLVNRKLAASSLPDRPSGTPAAPSGA